MKLKILFIKYRFLIIGWLGVSILLSLGVWVTKKNSIGYYCYVKGNPRIEKDFPHLFLMKDMPTLKWLTKKYKAHFLAEEVSSRTPDSKYSIYKLNCESTKEENSRKALLEWINDYNGWISKNFSYFKNDWSSYDNYLYRIKDFEDPTDQLILKEHYKKSFSREPIIMISEPVKYVKDSKIDMAYRIIATGVICLIGFIYLKEGGLNA